MREEVVLLLYLKALSFGAVGYVFPDFLFNAERGAGYRKAAEGGKTEGPVI
jgi:hypothetical protein